MSPRASRWILALYVALVAAIVVALNLGLSRSVFGFVSWVPLGDKVGHFVLIGILALLADVAAGRHTWKHLPTAPAMVMGLVTLEELSQLALTTRTFDLLDLAADLLGVAVFVSISRAGRLTARGVAPRRQCDGLGPRRDGGPRDGTWD